MKKTIFMLGTRCKGKQDIKYTCIKKIGTVSCKTEILAKRLQMKSNILINLLVKP